jgi:hypothetical protein
MLRICTAWLISILLAGCATQAQMQAEELQSSLNRITQEATACYQAAFSDPDVQILREKTPLEVRTNSSPSLAMLSDKSYISDAEADASFKLHAMVTPCRNKMVESLQQSAPMYVPVVVGHYVRSDETLVKLHNKEITWGQANEASQVEKYRYISESQAIDQKVAAGLSNAHSQEMAQRQAAANALQNWAYQQQVISSLNRTRYTNCTYIGGTMNCTTF